VKRWWVQGLVAILVIALVGWVSFYASHHLNWWNTKARRNNGGAVSLIVRPTLITFAVAHSQRMARNHRLFHTKDVNAPCAYWGENIGVGPTAYSVFRAFLQSPDHRANILNPKFRHIGIGAIRDDRGRLWITEEFCG
jgi:uncharacterized protein YkwD